MTDKIAEAQAQVREAESRLANARRLLEEARRSYPDEPQSDYISFNVQFTPVSKSYRYAAIRVAGRWYTTGGDQFDSWHALVDWIRKSDINTFRAVNELGSRPGVGYIRL